MHDHNHPEEHRSRRKKQEPMKPVLIFFVLLLLAVAGAGLFIFSGSDKGRISPDQTTADHQNADGTTPGSLIPMSPQKEALPIAEKEAPKAEPTAPEPEVETPEQKKARECQVLAGQIHGFFTHIDGEDYMKQFNLQKPSQSYFITLADKLLKNPPVVSRESDDLYTILKNMAHFFRVIGKDNIILIKAIMDRERDKIEDVAAEVYQWTTWKTCSDELLQFSPSLQEMYEYAGFFLNTMGGRSYLFRRDSRSRLLVNYYSILLIEQANREGLNRHGIDITPMISQLIQEIDSSNQLIYKENYIETLDVLLEKYQ